MLLQKYGEADSEKVISKFSSNKICTENNIINLISSQFFFVVSNEKSKGVKNFINLHYLIF